MKYVILAFILLTLTTLKSNAHDAPTGWTYPMECCGGMDCAPVDSWIMSKPTDPKELAQLIVTTKHGTVNIPPDFPKRESKDNRMHVCMQKWYWPTFHMKLICVFIPGGM